MTITIIAAAIAALTFAALPYALGRLAVAIARKVYRRLGG